jgi:guanylate kinase
VRALLEREPDLWFSVSATDRAPRPGEVDGRDYRFLTRDEFERTRDEGGFLESFDVYGDLKGTPRTPIEEHLAAGDDVLIEVNVQGALAIRDTFPDAFVVFIRAPSRDEQQARLGRRDPDAPPDVLARRLEEADTEERLADRFDATVVNADLDRTVDEVQALLDQQRRR